MTGLLAAYAIDGGVEVDVLGYGQVFVQAELLRHVADLGLDTRCIFANVHAEDGARAARRRQQAAKSLDDGGLSRTVGPQKAEDLASPDREAHVVHGSKGAKTNGQMIGSNSGIHWNAVHSRTTDADIPDFSAPFALST